MSHIQYIKNVTATGAFGGASGGTPGVFSKQINSIPAPNPDEVIIRAINFRGDSNDENLYLIWCNLTNDYIGSFCGGSLSPHFPQTTIKLNSLVPHTLEFKIYTPSISGDIYADVMTGELAIHMDFIKYRSVPSHA